MERASVCKINRYSIWVCLEKSKRFGAQQAFDG
jgi:hypothetical protein